LELDVKHLLRGLHDGGSAQQRLPPPPSIVIVIGSHGVVGSVAYAGSLAWASTGPPGAARKVNVTSAALVGYTGQPIASGWTV
jgi:hypothetical protein